MAHIWQFEGTTWIRLPLTETRYALHAGSPGRVQPAVTLGANGALATLSCHAREGQTTIWVLLSSEAGTLRVNGQLLLAGITVLHDRDEILAGGRGRFYFSTEEAAKVEPFPGAAEPVYCARCRQPVAPGTLAVRCPSCGHWCEQSDEKPCWTYGPTCPLCEQLTAFDTGLRWTPEEL